jgi:hypothetical protein
VARRRREVDRESENQRGDFGNSISLARAAADTSLDTGAGERLAALQREIETTERRLAEPGTERRR